MFSPLFKINCINISQLLSSVQSQSPLELKQMIVGSRIIFFFFFFKKKRCDFEENWSRAWSGFVWGSRRSRGCLESSSYILITCIEDDDDEEEEEDWTRRATNLFCLWERIIGGPRACCFAPWARHSRRVVNETTRKRERWASKCTGDDARSKPISNTWMHPDSKCNTPPLSCFAKKRESYL